MMHLRARAAAAALVVCLAAPLRAGSPTLPQFEAAYADLNDAAGAISLIDSGYAATYAGKDRKAWAEVERAKLDELKAALPQLSQGSLSESDRRALTLMRQRIEELAGEGDHSLAPTDHCADAARPDADYNGLRQSLYACFEELGNHLSYKGQTVTRLAGFDLLTTLDDAQQRKQVFLAYVPLWQAIDGHDEATSPYRRMMRMAAQQAAKDGSAIDAAAKTLGVSSAEVEGWLEQILDTWRQATPATPIEPWDYRYWGGECDRQLAAAIPRAALQPLDERYYRDLGVDLRKLGVLYDLDPRDGKAPLAYTDYVRLGRMEAGAWRPTIVRVSAVYPHGGLGMLIELVHENGHAAHYMALRTRPAFMDLGDPVFYEALADVPAWSLAEAAWQKKYLGHAAPQSACLRGLYSGVMLDVAWALFEARMLRDPARDPNQVWTEITSRYLHIKPHPEWAWWAVRVQLVDSPGYMVNYGLGAVVTADIRRHTREQIGAFDAGNRRWYPWLSENLLQGGEEEETAVLLRRFLGRPVSPAALRAELARLAHD